MTTIMAVAKKRSRIVVEDVCQAWMAEISDKKCGMFGNAGCYISRTPRTWPSAMAARSSATTGLS